MAMRVILPFGSKSWASVVSRSVVSLAQTVGFSLFLMASARAMAVAEFLEKSPARRAMSALLMAAFNSGDLSKEPVAVDLVKKMSGRGGSLVFRLSGR